MNDNLFNMHRTDKTKKLHDRLNWYNKKHYLAKRKKLKKDLMIGEKALVSAERIKKKAASGRFYKKSLQKISFVNKDRTFMIRKKQSINDKTFYWLTDVQIN